MVVHSRPISKAVQHLVDLSRTGAGLDQNAMLSFACLQWHAASAVYELYVRNVPDICRPMSSMSEYCSSLILSSKESNSTLALA